MNQYRKIIVENFPVERLPEELRRGLEGSHDVTITLEAQVRTTEKGHAPLTSFLGKAKGLYETPEAAVAATRTLRNEWP